MLSEEDGWRRGMQTVCFCYSGKNWKVILGQVEEMEKVRRFLQSVFEQCLDMILCYQRKVLREGKEKIWILEWEVILGGSWRMENSYIKVGERLCFLENYFVDKFKVLIVILIFIKEEGGGDGIIGQNQMK